MSENQKAVEQPCREEKIKYVTEIRKHYTLGFWRHNKQAHWANKSVKTATTAKRDIITALQQLYFTVWVTRSKLTALNQCDRVNDCFSLLNSGCGAAGPRGPQVTVRLSVISAQSHTISSPHFTAMVLSPLTLALNRFWWSGSAKLALLISWFV